ncbi:hypothetical protein OIO90_005637 [Microbotryomycetes sp. JL221]|nr:hypothetical protein OIO90_005637 [Microbotryomycetes sp. JL221]
MAAIWQLCCGCLGTNARYDDNDDHANERTALLNPDIIPDVCPTCASSQTLRAPVRAPKQTTEEQLAQQEALRKILHKAAERFVNIEAPSPFNNTSSPLSSRSTSPSRSSPPPPRSSSRVQRTSSERQQQSKTRVASWRPTFDDQNDDASSSLRARVKVVHLGPMFDIKGFAQALNASNTSKRNNTGRLTLNQQPQATRPMSAHSLKTLSRGTAGTTGGKPSPLRHHHHQGTMHDQNLDGTPHNQDEDGDVHVDDDQEVDDETTDVDQDQFGTTTSYQTARGDTTDSQSFWTEPPLSDELKKALQQLEQSVKSFKLNLKGPVVADLAQFSSAR